MTIPNEDCEQHLAELRKKYDNLLRWHYDTLTAFSNVQSAVLVASTALKTTVQDALLGNVGQKQTADAVLDAVKNLLDIVSEEQKKVLV